MSRALFKKKERKEDPLDLSYGLPSGTSRSKNIKALLRYCFDPSY